MRLADYRHLQTLLHPSATGKPCRHYVFGLHYKLQQAQIVCAQSDDRCAAAAWVAASLARAAAVDVVVSLAGHTWTAAAPLDVCAGDVQLLSHDQKQQQQQQRQVQC